MMKIYRAIPRQIKTTALLLSLVFSSSTFAASSFGHPIPSDKDVILTFGQGVLSPLPNRLSLLVWNLHKGADADFPTDFISLVYQKDLVLLEEMYLTPMMQTVFKSFPHYFYSTATSFLFGKVLTRTGVATSSMVMPTNIEYIRTQTREPVVNSPKVTLITQYPIGNENKKLTIANIHGINFVSGSSYQKEIDLIYEALKKVDGPLIFAGDFNTWSDERMKILTTMCKKLNLSPAVFFPDQRMRFNNHPLDHFFHSPDLKILSAKVEGFRQGSDHKPLEVVVEYFPLAK